MVCNYYMVQLIDTGNGGNMYIEINATDKGDYMFISKRQLRQDERILELNMSNTKRFADISKRNSEARYKKRMQELKELRKVYRLNQHLLNGSFVSESEKELYVMKTTTYWSIVA